ncbi:tetratricopeptide repeat protein [Sphingomonas sp. CGMCC 1.13654]|uniref:Tetratricopeptide repeat protein n=1 Tax=Sphingomonas chungangi TaxID=2683589 RepID=A0A838L3Z8_9SPHN|nr:tetratricopeptide repeat protein [Sphingomonas chungangi]MBA2933139.1 tetratricopeptide repeat protein [Sphingomonas chungangi]MVW56759.1 hypothetical protein [Sphingomonas chungangi]
MALSKAWLCGLGLLLLGADLPPSSPTTITEAVTGGAVLKDGSLWFTTWNESARFTLSPRAGDVDAVFTALRLASEAGVSIAVRFDPDSGRFDPDNGRIDYRLCAITYGAQKIGGDRDFCSGPSAVGGTSGEKAIAVGMAREMSFDTAGAGPLLDAGLAHPDLPAALRTIGLRARSDVHATLASRLPHGSPAADAELVLALADTRAWEHAAPDDREAPFTEGALLEELGAYPDALAVYQRFEAKWPDEYFRAQVRRAAIKRIAGDYPGALATLNEIAVRDPVAMGMKYHYHRGWLLSLMGRYEEAVADFSAGLETQPDYPYVFLRRACAYGRLGYIAEARSDEEAGLGLLAKLPVTGEPLVQYDVDHARAGLDALSKMQAEGQSKPTAVACDLSDPEKLRSRSKALPATPG